MLRLMWRVMEMESIEGYPRDLTTTPSLDPTMREVKMVERASDEKGCYQHKLAGRGGV